LFSVGLGTITKVLPEMAVAWVEMGGEIDGNGMAIGR
jgi:hypothetical protein